MSINTISEPTKEEVAFIDERVIQYNLSKINTVDKELFKAINFIVKDKNEKIIAGITGQKYYCNAAYIDLLWVAEEVRGQGLGSQLLNKFEGLARQLNCFMVHLDTFDFQAPAFYEKYGYTLYGTLNDNPIGHKRFYYNKILI
jgi:GNAT superfamily N-acetyltransferase